MEDIRLAHYIEKEKEKGFSNDKIKNVLDNAGFTKEEINDCFEYIENNKVEYEELDKESANEKELIEIAKKAPIDYKPRKMWIIVGSILLIIIGSFIVLKLGPTNIKFLKTPRIMDEHARSALFNSLVDKCAEDNPLDETCLALVKGDVSICKDHECQTEYFMTKAGFEKDETYCAALKDIRTKTACIALATTKDACNTLYGLNKDYCLAISDNPNKCTGADIKECKEEWQFANALKIRDLAACDKLVDNDKKIRCRALITGKSVECGNKVMCKDEAHLDIAIMTDDEQVCEKIKTTDTRAKCKKALSSFFG